MGHLIVAEQAREQLGLDKVLFMPAGQPWLKADRAITESHQRLRMVELAVGRNPHFEASDLEVTRQGPSYSVDTLENLTLRQVEELFLIVGMDVLEEFSRWHKLERVLEMATVVAASRPGVTTDPRTAMEKIKEGAGNQVHVLESPGIDVSSADIRSRICKGLTVRYMLPDTVYEYIVSSKLYTRVDGRP